MAKYLIVFMSMSQAAIVQAQEMVVPAADTAVFLSGSQFFVALLAGLCLAVAFQMLLTHLSVAAGITALKPVTAREKKPDSADKKEGGPMETARRLSTAYGIWTLATASLALFFAAWLAVELSLTASQTIGVILGLTIWGLFYIAMTTLQMSAVTSLAGSLLNAAASGLRTMRETAGSLLGKSPEKKAADTAAEVAQAVREELFGGMDAEDMLKQMRKMVKEVRPQPVDARQIREELAKLFNETEIRAMTVHNDVMDYDRLVATLHTKYGDPQHRRATDRAKEAISSAKEEITSGKSAPEKAVDAGLRMAGMSKEEAEKTRKGWEDYLRNTGKPELNPDNIRRELETLMRDPQAGIALLKTRVSEAFNRSTIVSLLAQRKDMTREDAERAAERIERVVQEIRSRGQGPAKSLESVQGGAVARVRDYLNSLNRPELKYEGLRDDIARLFQDPKTGAQSLLHRFKSMDRETIKSVVASRKDMSPEDAEHIVQQIESARDKAVGKAEQMKAEVERRMNRLKEESLRQAEEARKTAATAAWWAFATAVASGLAAVGGGMVAML
jgi:hypothetical protein